MNLKIYTDGGSRGNPGNAAIGVVIKDKYGKIISEVSEAIGKATNNFAEYSAFVRGLEEALKLKADHVEIFMDSELVVKQINREYKVRDSNLAKIFIKAWNLLSKFKSFKVSYIPREKNKKADTLVNIALDEL